MNSIFSSVAFLAVKLNLEIIDTEDIFAGSYIMGSIVYKSW
jgi:hypothetical protein